MNGEKSSETNTNNPHREFWRSAIFAIAGLGIVSGIYAFSIGTGVAIAASVFMIVFCAWLGVWLLRRSSPKKLQEIESSETEWKPGTGWKILFILVLLAYIGNTIKNKELEKENAKLKSSLTAVKKSQSSAQPRRNAVSSVSPPTVGRPERPRSESSKGEQTHQYWESSVAQLHRLRFSEPSDLEADAQAWGRQRSDAFRRMLSATRMLRRDEVDADLVEMVNRHVEIEVDTLATIDDFMKRLNKELPSDNQTQRSTTGEAFELIQDALDRYDPETSPLPDWGKHAIETMLQYQHWMEDQFIEILVMQARLQERYPTYAFDLPELINPSLGSDEG